MRRIVASTVMVLVFVGAGISTAMAAPCSQRGQFFIRNTIDKQYINGTTNSILLKNRALATGCDGPLTLSTAHVNRFSNGATLDQFFVEIGWREYKNSSGNKVWIGFSEVGHGSSYDVDVYSLPGAAVLGTYDKWRVVNNPVGEQGLTCWETKVDYGDGVGFRDHEQYCIGWHHGAAFGETEGFGGTTGMNDAQRSLTHKNNSGSWVDWGNQFCQTEFAAGGYRYSKISSTAYDIEAGTENC